MISLTLKFDHTTKYYMDILEFVLENESHEIFWDFDIETDQLIPAWRPDLVIINKKTKQKKNPQKKQKQKNPRELDAK